MTIIDMGFKSTFFFVLALLNKPVHSLKVGLLMRYILLIKRDTDERSVKRTNQGFLMVKNWLSPDA